MAKIKRGRKLSAWNKLNQKPESGKLRIVGGLYGGRQIEYSGDKVTRPMKDNIREALFNLVGGWVKEKAAFDLFAGTGAMGIEAISRGATKAFLIERHIPTVRIIRQNVRQLDPDMPVEIHSSDSFFWVRKFLKVPDSWPSEPWVVFCCPPYEMYVSQKDKIIQLIDSLMRVAPEGSVFVVESDERFNPAELPDPEKWRVRQYAPALISVHRPKDTGD